MHMPENTREHRWLIPHAKCDWKDVVRVLDGLECAWADYEGFHVESAPPAEVPPYSHIWAWNSDGSRLLRGRIDGEYVWLGELRTKEITPDSNKPDSEPAEKLPVVKRPIVTWNAGDLVIGQQKPEHLERDYYAVEVLSPNPVTFIGALDT